MPNIKWAWNDKFPPLNLWNYPMRFENAEDKIKELGRVARNVELEKQATNVNKEYTGGSVSYYTVQVKQPTNKNLPPYAAECNDIIEALGMNYAEGNAFKAIWRSCAARNLGKGKDGYKDGKYDAEKVVFFGQRMLESFK